MQAILPERQQRPPSYEPSTSDFAGPDLNRTILGSPETSNNTVRLTGSSSDDDAIVEAANLIAIEVHDGPPVLLLSTLTTSLVRDQSFSTAAKFFELSYNCNVAAGRGQHSAYPTPRQPGRWHTAASASGFRPSLTISSTGIYFV